MELYCYAQGYTQFVTAPIEQSKCYNLPPGGPFINLCINFKNLYAWLMTVYKSQLKIIN